jgi:hypothetical protein
VFNATFNNISAISWLHLNSQFHLAIFKCIIGHLFEEKKYYIKKKEHIPCQLSHFCNKFTNHKSFMINAYLVTTTNV